MPEQRRGARWTYLVAFPAACRSVSASVTPRKTSTKGDALARGLANRTSQASPYCFAVTVDRLFPSSKLDYTPLREIIQEGNCVLAIFLKRENRNLHFTVIKIIFSCYLLIN